MSASTPPSPDHPDAPGPPPVPHRTFDAEGRLVREHTEFPAVAPAAAGVPGPVYTRDQYGRLTALHDHPAVTVPPGA